MTTTTYASFYVEFVKGEWQDIKETCRSLTATKIVMQVLNEVFDIELTEHECSDVANRIIGVLSKKRWIL